MPQEGPYEILPYAEIETLKKEIIELKKKTSSSDEILDAVNRQSKIIESMLMLFEGAAESMKKEGESPLGKKVDKLLEQNETIAQSILNLLDKINDLQKEEEKDFRNIEKDIKRQDFRSQPGQSNFSMPSQGFNQFRPNQGMNQQSFNPNMQMPRGAPGGFPLRGMSPPPGNPSRPQMPNEPMPMPASDFKDLDLENLGSKKKEKKPLFNIKFK